MATITITESALEEIVRLAKNGFNIDITECHDGEPIVVMKGDTGLVRLFAVERR